MKRFANSIWQLRSQTIFVKVRKTRLSEDTLRVGVVGLGKMGLLHASLLNIMPNVVLAGVCEKSSLIRKMAKKLLQSVPIVDDVEKFSCLDMDAVFVTTPIVSHYNIAKLVYDQELARHVFVEKPLASNYVESKELSELSAAKGGVNLVGYLRRFMVTFMKARALLTEGLIGEPFSFVMEARSSDFFGVENNPKASIARGGVLRDLGSYAVDLAFWFFGDIQLGSAEVQSLTGDGAEDYAHFTAQADSDPLCGEFSVSWCADGYRMPEVDLLIQGSAGTIGVNDDKVTLSSVKGVSQTWFRHNLHDNVGFWLGNPEYYREDAYFVKSACSNSIAEPNFRTASKVDLFIDQIREKADRHA